MSDAVNHQRVMISPEQLIEWSQINLISYLPSEELTEELGKDKQNKTDNSLIEESINIPESQKNQVNLPEGKNGREAPSVSPESKEKTRLTSLPLTSEFSPEVLAQQQEYTFTIAPIAERWLKVNQMKTYEGNNILIEYVKGRLTIKDGLRNYKMIAQAVGVDEQKQTIWQCVHLPLNSPGLTIKDVEKFTSTAVEKAIKEKEHQLS